MIDDKNCVSTGKEREDRQVQAKNRFETLELDVKCPDTAILLLGSQERPVLVAAATALTKFAAKGKDNLQILFGLDIIDSLIPLVDHEDLFTRRFAARLLAEMSAIVSVKNYLLESEFHLSCFMKIFTKDSDVFIQEYISRLLAEISKDSYGSVKLLEHFVNLDVLFENLNFVDPDVKKNNIEIIDNLLKDFTGFDRVISSQAFNLEIINRLLEEPYPEIQSLALSVIESLVAQQHSNNRISRLFGESGTLLRVLLDTLESPDSTHLHSDIMRVLIHAVEDPLVLESLISGGGAEKLFGYFETRTKSREIQDSLGVLVRLANTAPGRKILHNLGVLEHLLRCLRTFPRDNQELTRIVCYGIGMMSRYAPAAKELAQHNLIEPILDILKTTDESPEWTMRQAAAFALKELCVSEPRNCSSFVSIKGPAYLESLLKQTIEQVPAEIGIMAIDVLSFIGTCPELRKLVLDAELIDALCASFKVRDRFADQLKIASCRALATFSVEKDGREIFLAKNLDKKLLDLLVYGESIPVRTAAVHIVQQLAADPPFAEQFVHTGYLNYMLKNRAISTVVPAWNTCIDALFCAHLPVKFASTGRLSLHDRTNDGFYVMRRHICPFPILDELFRQKMCPKEPIYVINFGDSGSSASGSETSRSSFALVETATRTSIDSKSARLEAKFGKLQIDPNLCEYLELIRCILAANKAASGNISGGESTRGIVDISKIASRATLLGKFVARRMSGSKPRNPCVDHQLEIHVREIREDIETSVIPLGQLRLGSYLERALLFKVMADRISLPATLVRGTYGKAWNELAIPNIVNSSMVDATDDFAVDDKESPSTRMKQSIDPHSDREEEFAKGPGAVRDNSKTVLPTRLLRENYIIDLMENPGDLMPIEGWRARTYCAPNSHCVMTCDV